MASTMDWVVLYGGAGREASVLRMLEEGVKVVAIVIPSRRSHKLEQAVSKLKAQSCRLIEVEKTGLQDVLQPLAGNALLSIGFPYLIPADLLTLFQPALNLHPTLLPRYRGPTSGAYILINNEPESGSTLHHMTAQMDRGKIVVQSRIALTPFDTIRSLQRKVYGCEPQLVIDGLVALRSGAIPQPQDETQASEYPKKRTPADSEIDPSLPLRDLINEIRACDPEQFPAFFIYHGEKVCIKLWRPEKTIDEFDLI